MWDAIKTLTNPESIIQYGGIVLLALVIFAETGIFFGFFLPGDNLVLLSGILCKTHPEWITLHFETMVIVLSLCAIAGNFVGYAFGYLSGKSLFQKQESRFFKPKHLTMAETYYKRYGGHKTLLIARFIPVLRTFAPILAGVIQVPLKAFAFYNCIGACLWIFSLSAIGYYSVSLFPELIQYMHWIFMSLIILTAIPVIRAFIKSN
ncbi:MAG: DedA family protein [Bacteroidia bacterium]|jgi:membrane-associated protein